MSDFEMCPVPPIQLVSGQPYVYELYWVHTGQRYVGSSYRGLERYEGSPGRAAQAAVRAAHLAIGAAEEYVKTILWSEPATKERTRKVEHAAIDKFRRLYGDLVVNKFPIRDRSAHLRWRNHDPQTHVDSTVNFPNGTFYKLQASDIGGLCSQCKMPWGSAEVDHFAKLVWLDGRTEWLVRPGELDDVYQACIRRKDEINGIVPDPSGYGAAEEGESDGDGESGELKAS